MNFKKLPKWTAVVIGILVGVIGFVAIRMLTVKNDQVHYHANFAIYINGARDELKSPLLYEEEQACNDPNSSNPRSRVHMHQPDNSVVHVHANAVTWNAFFNNLGYDLGDDYLKTGTGFYQTVDGGPKLSFVLNGQTVSGVANRVINDQDTLLINYGTESDPVLLQRYRAIPNLAKKHDEEPDPATCSGTEPLTFTTRLKLVLGIR